MRQIAEFVAVLSCGLFAGAPVYVNLVEHPARVECPVEVAAIERLIELFRDTPIGLWIVQGSSPMAAWDSADSTLRTSPNAATIGCAKGTGFQSTGAGKRGRRLPYRKCSTRARPAEIFNGSSL
jgi:hypothetical protein